jgi:DNA-directed RNA polymerase subunit E'
LGAEDWIAEEIKKSGKDGGDTEKKEKKTVEVKK